MTGWDFEQMRNLLVKGVTEGTTYSLALNMMREKGYDSVPRMIDDFLNSLLDEGGVI